MSINKKNFIHEINNSLINELCDDIINLFEKNNLNNKYFINNNNIEILKIYNALIKEITKNLKVYKINLLKIFEYDSKKNYINNFNINIEKIINKNTIFTIEKKMYNESNKNNESDFVLSKKYNPIGNTILKYIWFLNDYCGEFVFSEDIVIKPVKGKLIIFPVSWCFSFIENIKLFDTKYFIYGEIIN